MTSAWVSSKVKKAMNIDNNFFDSMVNHIYLSELHLNKGNVSDTEASFLDLHLSISDSREKIFGKYDYPYHFKEIIVRYKKTGYNVDVLR